MRNLIIQLSAFFLPLFTFAQQADSTKKAYSLFRAAPANQLREMQTDRPDVTESPYTLDAGHFQFESDIFKKIRNKSDEGLLVQNFFNLANLKLGLTTNTDLQLVVQSYVHNYSKSSPSNIESNSSGFGDLTIRLKRNIFGNDNAKTAFAIMPFVNLPVSKFSENNKIDGGIIFPFSASLKNNWSFGTQAEFDLLSEGNDYQSSVLTSFTFGKELNNKFALFAEAFDTYNFSTKKFELYLDAGLIYSVSDNLNLDAGFNYGVTKNSDKVYFLGVSFRL